MNSNKIIFSKRFIKFDKSILTENDYKYIDPDNLSSTCYKFEFPRRKQPDDNGDIMDNEMYIALANIIKMQYLLPVKYLKVNENNFSYIAQKSNSNNSINEADILIEPLNGNFIKQIKLTHINQMIPIGSVFYIHTEIPYRNSKNKLLTSASIKYNDDKLKEKIINEAKSHNINNPRTDICNKRIAYGALDIGSVLDMKMSVEYTDIHESLTLFRFNCLDDNIIEFIVYDHWNVDMAYIINLMKEDKRLNIPENERNYLNNLLDDMLKVIN